MFYAIDEVYFVIIICVVIVAVIGTLLLKFFLFGNDNEKSPKNEKTKNN